MIEEMQWKIHTSTKNITHLKIKLVKNAGLHKNEMTKLH